MPPSLFCRSSAVAMLSFLLVMRPLRPALFGRRAIWLALHLRLCFHLHLFAVVLLTASLLSNSPLPCQDRTRTQCHNATFGCVLWLFQLGVSHGKKRGKRSSSLKNCLDSDVSYNLVFVIHFYFSFDCGRVVLPKRPLCPAIIGVGDVVLAALIGVRQGAHCLFAGSRASNIIIAPIRLPPARCQFARPFINC